MPFQSISEGLPGPPGPAGPGTFTEETSIISVRDYGATGDGVTGDREAMYNAIAAANNRELLFPAGTYRVESDLTFSSTVAVRFPKGAKLSIDSGVTVTINGPLEAGLYQIFSGDGSVNIGKGAVLMVYPQWWGAIGDNSNDDTIALQAAIDSISPGGGVVYLASGTYKTSSGLTFSKGYYTYVPPGITIQGAGVGSTRINYVSEAGYAIEFSTGSESTAKTVCFHTIRDLKIEAPNTTGGGIWYEAGCQNSLENVAIRNVPSGKAIFMEANNYGSISLLNYFDKVFIGNSEYGFYMTGSSQALISNSNISPEVDNGIYAEGGIVWVNNTHFHTTTQNHQALNMTGGHSIFDRVYFDQGVINLNGGTHIFQSGQTNWINWTEGTVVHIGKQLNNIYVKATDVAYIPDEFNPMGIISSNDPRNYITGSEADDPDAANGKCIQLDAYPEQIQIVFSASYYRKLLTRGKYLLAIYTKDSNQVPDDLRIYQRIGGSETRNIQDYTLTTNYAPYLYMVTVGNDDVGSSVEIIMYKRTTSSNVISVDYVEVRYLGPETATNELVLHNPTPTDIDGGRVSRLQFWGEQSGGEIRALAEIRASHDGTGNNQKGRIEIGVNDGDDAYSPTTSLSIDSDGRVDISGRLCTSTIINFASGDSSPSVSAGNIFKTTNTGSTTITMFDDGVTGQMITVIVGDNNTVIDFTGTNLKGNGGTDWSPKLGDHMNCVFDGANWYCTISDNTP